MGLRDRRRDRDVLLILLAIWVGAWIWIARFHYLDDALIHLRYADMLREHGFLTFDGAHPSNGTSSLLYVVLLAAAGHIVDSIFLPKVLSVISYVALLGLTLRRALKAVGIAQNLWFLLLIVLASPMAVRWFTDGMETSLATTLALILGYSTMPGNAQPAGSGRSAAPVVLAFVWVFLRVEAAFLLAFICLGNAVYRFLANAHVVRPRYSWRAMANEIQLALGVALALLAIWLVTGHIVPDAAVAKAPGFYGVIGYALYVAGTFAASLSLGLGLLVLWIASTILAWMQAERTKLWALGVVNLALAAEVFTAMMRGQRLEGIRYFPPAVVMMVAWNLASLEVSWRSKASALTPENPQNFLSRISPPLIQGLAILMLFEWVFEGHRVRRVIDDRSAAFQEMRSQHLDVFAGQPGIAYDVGFISFFTHASICDMNGLVNGRQFASASPDERALRCAESSPVFAYVNTRQREHLSSWINLQGWSNCHTYELTNAFSRDPHYLLVKPDIAPIDCPNGDSASNFY